MRAQDLKTPCALVELDVLERNAKAMAEKATRLGVRLRPHVKTHKCVEAARIQTKGHFGGITVSTLAEAKAFAAGGFKDITYAVPIGIQRIQEAAELGRRLRRLNLVVDSEVGLGDLEAFGASHGVRFSVFLKVDCGYHRAGVDPEREESEALAGRMAASKRLDFRGILTHAGHAYRCVNQGGVRIVAEQEREVMLRFAAKLRERSIGVGEVSIGSTPTIMASETLEGITEIRPGNYAFFDALQVAIGSCAMRDCAFTVLTSVVGHHPERGEMIVDAGALALSKDPGPVHVDPECGFGRLLTPDGRLSLPHLRMAALSQEHGQVPGARDVDFQRFPIGSKLRIVPNHSCLTAACFDRYHVVREKEVVDEWKPARGW